MQKKGQTTTFPAGDFVRVTVRGPCEFDVWCESTQVCMIEPHHGVMASVEEKLKAAQ
jgi:hypothetical protein